MTIAGLLMISEEEAEVAREVMAYADAHRFDAAKMRWVVSCPQGTLVAELKPFTCSMGDIELGFSIEEHEEPLGWCRHLSMSDGSGVPVNPAVTYSLCQFFGFVTPVTDCLTYMVGAAVNVIEPLENPIERVKAAKEMKIVFQAQPTRQESETRSLSE